MEFNGIDISRHQGDIDFKTVKDSGIDFIMVRSSYGSELDTKFLYNLEQIKKYNIPCGIFHFTLAVNEAQAIEEIDNLFKTIKGMKFEYPVAWDMEDEGTRYTGMSRDKLTSIAVAGLNRIEEYGYFAINYTNPNWLEYRYNKTPLSKYDLWLAAWQYNKPTKYSYGMWQYTSNGKIPGIVGRVDLDKAYKNYKNIMVTNGLNGFSTSVDIPVENYKRYVVKPGDSFWSIAQSQLGDGRRYEEIAYLNNMLPSDTIYKGNVLKIPRS